MAKCLNVYCNNEVVSQEGKRQKKTCSDSCRQKVWQNNKKDSKYVRVLRIDWEKLIQGVPEKEWKNTKAASSVELSNEIILNQKSEVPLKKIIIKEGEFRSRREDEDVYDYGAAKNLWKLNK